MASWYSTWLGLGLIGAGVWGVFTGMHDHKLYVFSVNGASNVLHLLSGAFVVVAAFAGNRMAKLACLALAVVFGTLAGAGFAGVTAVTEPLNMNPPNELLYAGIALLSLVIGMASRSD